MPITVVALSSGYNVGLTYGSYTIKKLVLTGAGATNITLFDSDDTNRAIVHAATTSVANSTVDKYTYYSRSTTAGEQGKPVLLDTPGSPSGQSIEVPSETAPLTSDPDDTAALNDYVTTTGTSQTQKFTGITATVSTVTANSVTVPSFAALSCTAGGVTTWEPTSGIQLARGLVINSDATATLTITY